MSNKRYLCVLILIGAVLSSCSGSSQTKQSEPGPAPTPSNNQSQLEIDLEKQFAAISERVQGSIGVALVHVETGRAAGVNAKKQLPLYSVFKLPVAIAVLKDVEANRFKLDQNVHVTPAEIVPGTTENTARWYKPADWTIAQLIEVSISKSDNTSTDKLLQLIGGPSRVTERMRTLGFNNLDIHSSVMDYVKNRQTPNHGSAEDIANLLSHLQQGKLLNPTHTQLLIGFMRAADTGLRRLRGDLPTGTLVADKTGSGERDPQTRIIKAVNDVGIITLPDGRGNLAMAVFITGSSLPDEAQEKLIAELARTAFDVYTKNSSR